MPTKLTTLALATAAALVLILLILISPQGLTNDESWYLNQVGYAVRHGLSHEFWLSYRGAAGPLFAWLHALLLPLTHLDLPAVRLVNAALFVALAPLVALIATRLGFSRPAAIRAAVALLFFAPLWKCAGLAYTELPAILTATIALAILSFLGARQRPIPLALTILAASAATSLAILGRQPFLLLSLLLIAIGLIHRRTAAPLIAIGMLSLLAPAYAFFTWSGLQPPAFKNQPIDLADGVGFAILSFFYAGLIALLIRPAWLLTWDLRQTRHILAAWLVTLAFTVALAISVGLPPVGLRFSQLADHLPGGDLLLALATLALATAAALRLSLAAWQARHAPLLLLATLLAGGLIVGHLAIGPVFSNRYMAVAAPFLILAIGPDLSSLRLWIPRAALGIAWGALSLWGHIDGRGGVPFQDSGMEIFYPHLWQDTPWVFSEEQWEKFDYANSPFIQDPLVGPPVTTPWQPNPNPNPNPNP